MPYGPPPSPWDWQTSGYSQNLTWTYQTGSTSQPFVTIPVQPAMIEPGDDSPLAWLRGQVTEICDLAWAA